VTLDVRSFLDAFDPSLFFPELIADSREDVLRQLSTRLHEAGVVQDAGVVLEMLRGRERLGATALGHGIAVPHGRSLAVRRLVAGFARPAGGVSWEAPDGQPVRLVFLVLAPPPEPSGYLPFLGRLVESVNDDARRARLLEVRSFEELREALRDALS
jgi:mannitol/fructose-specific phosphotransferase system IIA component (Ntr-type)